MRVPQCDSRERMSKSLLNVIEAELVESEKWQSECCGKYLTAVNALLLIEDVGEGVLCGQDDEVSESLFDGERSGTWPEAQAAERVTHSIPALLLQTQRTRSQTSHVTLQDGEGDRTCRASLADRELFIIGELLAGRRRSECLRRPSLPATLSLKMSIWIFSKILSWKGFISRPPLSSPRDSKVAASFSIRIIRGKLGTPSQSNWIRRGENVCRILEFY